MLRILATTYTFWISLIEALGLQWSENWFGLVHTVMFLMEWHSGSTAQCILDKLLFILSGH